jgi:Flp pilus assembly protein TadD/2-polyprenyl-3-methyl-5-hydroxy-6-metoxy-1,4-benzoquinol methylase
MTETGDHGQLATLIEQGLSHHRAGRLGAAVAAYGDVLALAPGHHGALHLLGVVAHQAGEHDRAATLIRQAIGHAPLVAAYHNHLGAALLAAARPDDAIVAINRAIEINPDLAEAHYNLGVALSGVARPVEAEAALRRAIALDPNHAKAHNNLGGLLKAQDRMDEAITTYQTAIHLNPRSTEAQLNLAIVLHETGVIDEAIAAYQRALEIKPDDARANGNLATLFLAQDDVRGAEQLSRRALASDPACGEALGVLGTILRERKAHGDFEVVLRHAIKAVPDRASAHNNLGITLFDLGQPAEAMTSVRRAVELEPGFAEAHSNLSHLLLGAGKSDEAFQSARTSIALAPDNALFWARWAESLPRVSFAAVDDSLYGDLARLLDQPATAARSVTGPIAKALLCHPELARLQEALNQGDGAPDIDYWSTAERLSSIPLLLRVMVLSPINNLEMEAILTFLRRAALGAAVDGDRNLDDLPFSTALALHCFTNEYVFAESAEERALAQQLRDILAVKIKTDEVLPPSWIAVLGAYIPLFTLSWADSLLDRDWPEALKPLITRQIAEPLEEQSLRGSITLLTSVTDTISQAVREQYEENPYPRWIKPAVSQKPKPLAKIFRELGLEADTSAIGAGNKLDVLVAGCGSGQHAMATATRLENSRVLAMDLSLSSLAYAVRKTTEFGTAHIEYAQGDILELTSLGRSFDIIECGGVLHHLKDPMTGWKNLADVLRPDGFMKIGLYSEIARQPIVKARDLIASRGYEGSAQGIRRCRGDIIAEGHNPESDLAGILGFTDFYSLSECRDLLFHVQEHRFTVPQIVDALQILDLTFLGFEMRDWAVTARFKQRYPDRQALTSLPLWHEFETDNPQAFSSMYQFWVQKR